MSKKAIKKLFEKEFSRLIIVSCNLKAMIDNLKEFSYNGFKIKKVMPLDMFPQTKHMEVVLYLEK